MTKHKRQMSSVDTAIYDAFKNIERVAKRQKELMTVTRMSDTLLRKRVQEIRTWCDAVEVRLSIEDYEN